MAERKKMTAQELSQEKHERMMNGIATWASFYRANPQRFCKDYLNIHLKLFQKILIYAMITNNYFAYIASRGQGKTWLTALYIVVRAILFPSSKIVCCSATRTQGNEILLKITDDFCKNYGWGSDNLKNEIAYARVTSSEAKIEFKNGSWIRVVTASDSGRGARANVLIVDEFRMVDLDVINTVLRRFLTAPRTPAYLRKPEYANRVERNSELYLSSAWYQSHWSFEKMKAYFANMMDDTKKYFVCSLPYQLAIKENLLSREQVQDEMSEEGFDFMKFSMEMEALFYGDTDGAFFTYDDISKRRKIKNAFYPLEVYQKKGIQPPKLQTNEQRILSVDVALLASKKHDNDASALVINSSIPTDNNNYISNIVYVETHEGLTTDDLGLIVMRTFYQYNCTQLVLDSNGIGLGVYDYLIKDQYDPEYSVTYPALSCCNDDEMAERCKVKGAKKVIWSIKANATFNNEMCILLRSGFQNGKINLLASEFDADEILKDSIKGFAKLPLREQTLYKIPYVQTALMVNELINLEHEVKGTNIKIKERSGMRKDRYSSLGYNFWVATQLERKLKPKKDNGKNIVDRLPIRTGKRSGLFQ